MEGYHGRWRCMDKRDGRIDRPTEILIVFICAAQVQMNSLLEHV